MSSGVSKTDSVCSKCTGTIKANVTRVMWSGRSGDKNPDGTAKVYHTECYWIKPHEVCKKRNEYGQFADGTESKIPETKKELCGYIFYHNTQKVVCLLDKSHGGDHRGILGEDVIRQNPNTYATSVEVKETPKPEVKTESKPVAKPKTSGNGDAGIIALIAAEVLTQIKDDVSTKVDESQVKAIAETIVNESVSKAVETALENHTRTIIINDVAKGEIKKLEGLQHKQFGKLLTLIQSTHTAKTNVIMVDKKGKGGPGSGKTFAAEQASKALNCKMFGHISLNVQSQPSLIMGYNDAQGRYVRTQFREAYEHGGMFFFDEIFAGNGNFLTSLNGGLINGAMAFPDAIVTRHPDFIALAADNTNGLGANSMHSTRQVADAAFRERFAFLEWEYDEKLERKVSLAYNDNADDWVSWVQKVRTVVATQSIKMVVSPRASIVGAQLLKDGFSAKETSDLVLFKGADTDTVSKVLANAPLPS